MEQRRTLKLWFEAARWCYSETVARLKRTGEAARWKTVKTEIIHAIPDRLKDAPYQVKSIGVRDACRAMSAVKRRNRALAPDFLPVNTTNSDSAAGKLQGKDVSFRPAP